MMEPNADTAKFAKELGFSWRALHYEKTQLVGTVDRFISGPLPQLIVMDQNGRVLANGVQSTTPSALNQLTSLLNQNAASARN